VASKQFRPMLAETLESVTQLRFPVLVSPKLDGIRCVIREGKALSRSLKPIPNEAVRKFLEGRPELEGLDGELMVHGATFQTVTSTFMSRSGALPGGWYFGVFDALPIVEREPYTTRLIRATAAVAAAGPHIVLVEQSEIANADQLDTYEAKALELGFEGVMIRRAAAFYKHGRSTATDGALLKLKRFADGEATVIGFAERMHNGNIATTSAIGRTQRSSAKAGKSQTGSLGALLVRECATGIEFEVGTGFTESQRQSFWREQTELLGRTIKYKHFVIGAMLKPRFPTFVGFRAAEDMG